MTTIYNSQSRGNILVVGKTDSRKTYFVQKPGLNDFLGKIKKQWVSGVKFNASREAETTQSCFNHNAGFHSATDTEELKI